MLGSLLWNDPDPATFYFALISAASATPTVDTNTVSDLTEIAAANGYTSGGVAYPRAAGASASNDEDDANNYATFTCQNVTACQADGGTIPSSGLIRWGVITTNEVTVADRQIIAVFELDGTGITVPDGKELNISGHKIRISTPV